MNLATGTVLQNGKYVVEAVLGQGGFGITYRAHHAYFDQPVVIKVLHENLRRHADFAQFQQQFIAEARRVARCQHPNIVRVFDFFEEGGLSFIVMDYIPGDTLADIVQSEGALPEAKAIHYIRQIGAALNVVHQAGLLHRDVKPHNIIRREHTDFVVLIDFGIAREFTPGVTQTHTGMLSAGYAPIEQYLPQGKRTPAIDIYALAATLYSLVTGQAPIAAPLRDRVPLVDIRQFQPQITPALEQAILRGMAMEAEARPQTLAEWLALLPASNFVAPATGVAHGVANSSKLPTPPHANPASRPPSTPVTVTSATLPVVPRHTPAPPPAAVAPVGAAPTSATVVAAQGPQGTGATPAASRKAPPPQPAPTRSPFPKALLGAAAIATCIGAAFGLVLRFSGGQAGSTFLHNDQSFPEKSFPGQEVPASVPPDVPVEREAPQDNTAPEPEPSPDQAPVEPNSPPIDLAPTPDVPVDAEVTPSPVEPVVTPDPITSPDPVPVEASPIPAPEPVVEPEPQPPTNSAAPAPEPEPPSDNPASSLAPPVAPEPLPPSP